MFPKLCCFHLLLPASLRSLLLSCIVVLCPAAVVSLGYCEDATPPEEDKGASEQEQHSSSRPNFLVIITDDQRHDAVGAFMPRTQRRIFDEGVAFERGYITTSACAPSRASVLTGLYARNHGVRLNSSPFTKTSIAQLLQSKGYHTGLVGKYINTSDGGQAPGYDYWVSMPGGSGAFINPLLVVGKERSVHPGYVTHLFRDYALDFLQRASSDSKPFFFIFAPTAPHNPATPEAESAELYKGLAKHRPRSFNEANIADKPQWLQHLKSLTPQRTSQVDRFRLRQLRTLWPLDRAIDDLLNALDNHKVASNTVVIFISDNGMMWGEHRLLSKNVVYEESTRVPFAIRYPKFPGGIVRPEVVANIDIAPTILELAGIQSPWKMDGVSLVPLLTNAAASSGTASHWRPGIVLEGWLSKFQRVPFNAFHTDQFVYVENNGGDKELYDLKIDPGQNTNLIGRSRTYLEIETQMAKMLREAGVVPIATVREKRRDGKRAPRQVPSCRRCRPED